MLIIYLLNNKFSVICGGGFIGKVKDLEEIYGLLHPRAVKALMHLVKRAELFNDGYYPVIIDKIKVMGSSLRYEVIGDVDFVVECIAKEELWNEFIEFKEHLNSNLYEIWELLDELRLDLNIKVTINDLIENFSDELLMMGFKDEWLKYWLCWMRIEDLKFGIDRGLPVVFFDVNKLVERFLKSNWHDIRLQIIPLTLTPSGEIRGFKVEGPALSFWTRSKGLRTPNVRELEEYLSEEFKVLRKKALEIKSAIEDERCSGPFGYGYAIALVRNLDYFLSSNLPEIVRKIIVALRSYVLSELNNSLKLSPKGNLKVINTKLREHLKNIYISGLIAEKLTTTDSLGKYWYWREKGTITIDLIVDMLYKKLKPFRIKKKDVVKIVNIVSDSHTIP